MQTPNAERPTSNVELGEGKALAFGRIIGFLVALAIGGLFVYAGVIKIIDPVEFARDVDNYKMLPWQAAVFTGLYLPWLEVFAGLALITRVLYRGGIFILTVLMFVFLVATLVAKARGLDISCGCFGHASHYLNFAWHLVLDLLVLGGLFFLWKRQRPAV